MIARAALWERLVAAGIATGPPPAGEEVESPWYVTAMVAVAAWLAAVFLLAFLGIALERLLREPGPSLVVGVIMCALCAGVLRLASGRIFVTQLAVAASLAGQALVAYGLLRGQLDAVPPWLALAVFEAVLVAAAPADLHRVLCTLAAAFAVHMALANGGFATLYPAVLAGVFVIVQNLAMRADAPRSPWPPVAAGAAVAVLLGAPLALVHDALWAARSSAALTGLPAWFGTPALAAVFVAAIGCALREARVPWGSRTGLAATAAGLAVVVAAWPVPGVVVALIVLLLAFAGGRPALQGLAVLALLGALAHYYYALASPFTVKAAALFATGVVLLGARFLVSRAWAGDA